MRFVVHWKSAERMHRSQPLLLSPHVENVITRYSYLTFFLYECRWLVYWLDKLGPMKKLRQSQLWLPALLVALLGLKFKDSTRKRKRHYETLWQKQSTITGSSYVSILIIDTSLKKILRAYILLAKRNSFGMAIQSICYVSLRRYYITLLTFWRRYSR